MMRRDKHLIEILTIRMSLDGFLDKSTRKISTDRSEMKKDERMSDSKSRNTI